MSDRIAPCVLGKKTARFGGLVSWAVRKILTMWGLAAPTL